MTQQCVECVQEDAQLIHTQSFYLEGETKTVPLFTSSEVLFPLYLYLQVICLEKLELHYGAQQSEQCYIQLNIYT